MPTDDDRGRVRYVGDPVALVIAETVWQAKDAAERLEIDYEALASVTDTAQTVAPGAPAVWDECPDNISNVFEAGNAKATDEAFAKAAHVVRRRYVISRVYAHYMQPRGGRPNTMKATSATRSGPTCSTHQVRNALAENIFKIPEHRIR
ncbi:MAG: xanthine dehydrogenase family protein molybdopterin-binding subunit [Burkholderiaceae bacterium]|nr:xanthine dehydrogenase family protein molybdopterin-binding subunit [Burkholderiaceae bacterium]